MMFTAPDADAGLLEEPTKRCLARRGLPACKVIPNDEIAQERRHAIGTEFSVPATTMADAADLAFEVTLCAFAEAGVECKQLYELTVWPPRP